MKFKKAMTGLAIGSLLFLGACGQNQEIASTTAGRIRQDEFYERLKTNPSPSGGTYGEIVLQQMLLEDILEQAYGDQVSDEEVQAEIDDVAEAQGGREALEETLANSPTDMADLEQSIKMNLMIRAAVADRADFSEEDVREHYDSQVPEGTRMAHILVDEEQEAKDIIEELNDGADFAELAEERSQDPGSASNGGEYELETGRFVPEVEEAAMSLDEGEITEEPVESSFGYHVIKLLEKGEKEDFEDAKEEATNNYVEDELLRNPQVVNSIMTELVQEANVNIADSDLQNAMAPFLSEPQVEEEDPDQEESDGEEEDQEEGQDQEEDQDNGDDEGQDDDQDDDGQDDSDQDDGDQENDDQAENEADDQDNNEG